MSSRGGKAIVLVAPGVMGSELQYGTKILWPSSRGSVQLQLACNPQGVSLLPITATKILENWNLHIYKKQIYGQLLTKLKNNGYQDIFPCPYDWRLPMDVTSSVFTNVINQIRKNPANNDRPIKIIAHSMGGCLFNHWLAKDYDININKFDEIIYCGTPVFGTPKMLALLGFGTGSPVPYIPVTGIGLQERKLKALVKNFGGVYNLLPGLGYVATGEDHIWFQNMISNTGYEENYTALENLGLNDKLMNKMQQARENIIQKLCTGPQNQLTFNSVLQNKAHFIIGTNQKTVNCVYSNKGVFTNATTSTNGDGTVMDIGLKRLMKQGHAHLFNTDHLGIIQDKDPLDEIMDIVIQHD